MSAIWRFSSTVNIGKDMSTLRDNPHPFAKDPVRAPPRHFFLKILMDPFRGEVIPMMERIVGSSLLHFFPGDRQWPSLGP